GSWRQRRARGDAALAAWTKRPTLNAEGQRSASSQRSQRGSLAVHTSRPNQVHEVALDLHRVGVPGQAEAPREPPHVGVDDDALVAREERAQYHVGRLAPDPGELDQLVDGLGDLAAVVLEQVGGRPLDRLGL